MYKGSNIQNRTKEKATIPSKTERINSNVKTQEHPQVYIMGKYNLHFATDREHDMRSMLQLALASDVAGKTAAIICLEVVCIH